MKNRHVIALLGAFSIAAATCGSPSDSGEDGDGGAAGTATGGDGGAAGEGVGGTAGGAAGNSAGSGGTAGGAAGSGGAAGGAAGNTAGRGGAAGATAGAGGRAGNGGTGGAAGAGGTGGAGGATSNFSFFVTSLARMRQLSGSQNGFGGDLRFGEATGLAGADKICTTIAEMSMPGAGAKTWRAFLSTSSGGQNNGPIHAIDRIGNGPWYDRMGRIFAMNRAALLAGPRPQGAAPQIINDFPNEDGVPNRMGTDNHDTLTGSNRQGQYPGNGSNCSNWTSKAAGVGQVLIGHSWPRNAGNLAQGGHWISDHPAQGCQAVVNLEQNGGGPSGCDGVGCGGGYGGLYCFALTP